MMEPGEPRRRLVALAGAAFVPGALAEAALWIAAEEYPGLDVGAWMRRLDALGWRAAERLTPAMDAESAAAALGGFLFEEEGFRGNTEDYYDPRNSFLNDVLERRLGIPITLAVVYVAVAGRAGVAARGVGLPGHFVVAVERHGRRRLVDPFHGGRLLDEADCQALVRRVHGPEARLDPAHLLPVTTRQVLARMLGNLKGVYAARGDWPRALAAVDRILLLTPDMVGELRDRGDLHARAGQATAALRDWEAYLGRAPDAPDADRVRRRLRALRQALSRLN